MNATPLQRWAECAAVCRSSEPMTRDELIALQSAKAKVRAEDERRREPVPQLDLEDAA